jgi:hypothetical protein
MYELYAQLCSIAYITFAEDVTTVAVDNNRCKPTCDLQAYKLTKKTSNNETSSIKIHDELYKTEKINLTVENFHS